jgi:tripartite ATP-independent transporter DctP family solute receptor
MYRETAASQSGPESAGRRHMNVKRALVALTVPLVLGLLAVPVAADYKPEFKLSLVISKDTPWGKAATRFADVLRHRTQGRINITNYFDGQLFAGKQTTEFLLLQQGVADFAMGSTINWSAQVKELNLFALPFLFQSYQAVDAVQAGEPGKRLFTLIGQKGVVPITWGENGFRELTNSKRPVRRPEDLQGLKVRVVGIPIFVETFRALGADPVSMDWNTQALAAFRQGTVDGQENPIGLIIPYKLWEVHKYVTLWHYAIDPVILAVSAKTWVSLSPADRTLVRKVGEEIMALQKREVREGLEGAMTVLDILQKLYGMEGVQLTPGDVKAFRDKTRPVYSRWVEEIGRV